MPHAFVTRAKYVVVDAGVTVTEDAVAPSIAVLPANHWYASGALPDAVIERVAELPATIVVDCGCAVIVGDTHADCATEIVVPATLIEPLRAAPLFAEAAIDTDPSPLPPAPDVIVIHGVAVDADHAQPPLACTAIDAEPPPLSKLIGDATTSKLQTVTVAVALSALPHAFITRAK